MVRLGWPFRCGPFVHLDRVARDALLVHGDVGHRAAPCTSPGPPCSGLYGRLAGGVVEAVAVVLERLLHRVRSRAPLYQLVPLRVALSRLAAVFWEMFDVGRLDEGLQRRRAAPVRPDLRLLLDRLDATVAGQVDGLVARRPRRAGARVRPVRPKAAATPASLRAVARCWAAVRTGTPTTGERSSPRDATPGRLLRGPRRCRPPTRVRRRSGSPRLSAASSPSRVVLRNVSTRAGTIGSSRQPRAEPTTWPAR